MEQKNKSYYAIYHSMMTLLAARLLSRSYRFHTRNIPKAWHIWTKDLGGEITLHCSWNII
jgi:hypothetical protein